MDIKEKFNQEKESTIQYDISELLQTDLSDNLKSQLEKLGNNDVAKFLSLFPIPAKTRISEIKVSLDGIKEILPQYIFEETKDEVREICDDYKWRTSRDGKMILEIEDWIKKARHCLSTDYPSELIYIGRNFIEPISLIIGGYVKDLNTQTMIELYFNNMNPPIAIEYRISS